MNNHNKLRVVWWNGDGVGLLDQTLLPHQEKEIICRTLPELWEAIKNLRVRGAPAIGVAAAYGVVLAAQLSSAGSARELREDIRAGCDFLATSRPTAVNLFWALEQMQTRLDRCQSSERAEIIACLEESARKIDTDNAAVCEKLSTLGASLLPEQATIITHCNAGGIACGNRYGTALGVILKAHEQGKQIHVYVDETRPLLQGARLTAWELMRAGIDATLICDNMAAHVMRDKGVNAVVFGADRIACNGDTANKIGSYGLAVLAQAHQIPVYVAAPLSTIDFNLDSGGQIPIEERSAEEVAGFQSIRTAPEGVKVYNPAFDVTPGEYISAIICEQGILRAPYPVAMAQLEPREQSL